MLALKLIRTSCLEELRYVVATLLGKVATKQKTFQIYNSRFTDKATFDEVLKEAVKNPRYKETIFKSEVPSMELFGLEDFELGKGREQLNTIVKTVNAEVNSRIMRHN